MSDSSTASDPRPALPPPLIYGTAWKKERTAALVEQAIVLGFRGIDTACQPKHYDEAAVGVGIAACAKQGIARHELYVQTKFTPVRGQDPRRIPYDPNAPLDAQVRRSCDVSLKQLSTPYIDCLVLHSPLPSLEQTELVWQAMEQLVEQGRVRAIGLSNCYDLNVFRQIWSAAKLKPSVLQNRFYQETGYDVALRQFCQTHDISYQSFWSLTANPHLLRHSIVRTLAERYGRTEAQVLFRYLTQLGITPLTGTSSEQHMREDLAIFEFALTAEEVASVNKLLD